MGLWGDRIDNTIRVHVQGAGFGHQQVIGNIKLEFTSAPPVPLPEPETYAMLLAGLGLVGCARRRKARVRA
nr:PEP-CTERM sorting domain-containing protein [Rugamonas fusca]